MAIIIRVGVSSLSLGYSCGVLLRKIETMLPATRTLYFEDLSVGLTESYDKEVKSSDVVGFAEITGDRNPIDLRNTLLRRRHSEAASLTVFIRPVSFRR